MIVLGLEASFDFAMNRVGEGEKAPFQHLQTDIFFLGQLFNLMGRSGRSIVRKCCFCSTERPIVVK